MLPPPIPIPDRLCPDMADPGREGGRLTGDEVGLVMNGLVLGRGKAIHHLPSVSERIGATTGPAHISPLPPTFIVLSNVMLA
jgi:hypothetical protein